MGIAARSIFIGGTASHAGKSWMATAICRSLCRRGIRVAPFKAQNMSNNSFPCSGGGEIGRAQVAQAEACGLEPHPDMNPILLKPSGRMGCQIVLDGKVWRNVDSSAYHEHFDCLLERAVAAYDRLAQRFEYIVIEGAGSVVELNLKSRDLANLSFARMVGAPGLLVADIDRGGVFASVVGTYTLLDEEEREQLRSFAVNRFHGDPAGFEEGVRILEQRTGKPCLGVFPMAHGIHLDDEDAVAIETRHRRGEGGPRIAAIAFPHISNTTDFQLIGGWLEWVVRPAEASYDFVILPGTKSTIADLEWLHRHGLAGWIVEQWRAGATVIGICGGYQMLGESVEDPLCVESGTRLAAGLGLLPVRTVMESAKVTRAVEAITPAGARFRAYEIHMGATARPAAAAPFAYLSDGTTDGVRGERCLGTYFHGALEDPGVVEELFGARSPARCKQQSYSMLADWFDKHARGFEEMYL